MTVEATTEYKKFGTTDVLMLLIMLFWAVNFSFLKIVFREMEPLAFNGIRLILASLLLVLICLLSGESLHVGRSDFWKIVGLGFVGNTLFQLVFIFGLDLTTASNSSIIIALTPVTIALLSMFMKHEKIHPAAWAGIILSFVGFYLVISSQYGAVEFSQRSLWGDILIFTGNIFWALFTVFSWPMLKRYSPLKLSTLTMVYGTILYVPFSLQSVLGTDYQALSRKAWVILVYSAVFSLVIPYIVWYLSVKRIGNSKTAIYDNLMPVLTILFAYFMIDERITHVQAVGALIIFVGVYLTRVGYKWFIMKDKQRFINPAEKND
jgi:drug/metabolite transporter (DMT)-like permease